MVSSLTDLVLLLLVPLLPLGLRLLFPLDLDRDLILNLLPEGTLDLLIYPDREELLEPDSFPLSMAIKHKKSEIEIVQAHQIKISGCVCDVMIF